MRKFGKVCNKTTMRKRLERFDEADFVDETNDFGMDFSRRQRLDLEHHPRHGSSTLEREKFGIVEQS